MESAKTQKWSDDDFVPWNGSSKEIDFKPSERVWEGLRQDPQLKTELDDLVEKKVMEKLRGDHAEELAKVREEARARGMSEGVQEGHARVAEIQKKLDAICADVLASKEALLRSHQEIWIAAYEHLARTLLWNKDVVSPQALSTWIQSSLEDFAKKEKVTVFVSDREHAQLSQTLKGSTFALQPDPQLAPGQWRLECGDGGVFYSPDSGFEKLTQIVKRSLDDVKRAA